MCLQITNPPPKFIVTKKAMRPASPLKRCFYCLQDIGKFHLDSCVTINKRVVVQMTIEYEIEAPADWDEDQIEFHRNEASWCSNNMIPEINRWKSKLDKESSCLCGYVTYKCPDAAGTPYLKES